MRKIKKINNRLLSPPL